MRKQIFNSTPSEDEPNTYVCDTSPVYDNIMEIDVTSAPLHTVKKLCAQRIKDRDGEPEEGWKLRKAKQRDALKNKTKKQIENSAELTIYAKNEQDRERSNELELYIMTLPKDTLEERVSVYEFNAEEHW